MSNHLSGQTSPYLLQHANNPVDWYPWCAEAFEKAKREDKPVFLSIGYSTCHWCHVMAHESFEDPEIADILNRHFVSVKVDKEERPDIDSIYMAVCQAFTGGGGWPTSIIMTADQKPFFAGTYFPKTARYGSIGFKELLLAVAEKWETDRDSLLQSADEITAALNGRQHHYEDTDEDLIEQAVDLYKRNYDDEYGGFGSAPKFPAPNNLMFLMRHYRKYGDAEALKMAEVTLMQMYSGGIFDHIGYGFCRYSTDRYFLVPHFEKMLYDNALLISAYSKAYETTKRAIYMEIAEKTASYVLSEMRSEGGGFFSAQDADSDGEEGGYYVFRPSEITELLGEDEGAAFNKYFGITESGNFEGRSIPNLLGTRDFTNRFDRYLPRIREFRKKRASLHTDDKIITSWNCLMIAALCHIYRVSGRREYLDAAEKAMRFIEDNLSDGDTLYVSWRNGKKSGKGFLEDYACFIYALLAMYDITFDREMLNRAARLTAKTVGEYFDEEHGGFYIYGKENETLIFRPKDTYDGAMPSGNSLMAYNLVKLSYIRPDGGMDDVLQKQLRFMSGEAKRYPAGYAMFMTALSDYTDPPAVITVVRGGDDISELPLYIPSDAFVKVLDEPTDEYRLINGRTAIYECRNRSCLPPVNKDEFIANNKVGR